MTPSYELRSHQLLLGTTLRENPRWCVWADCGTGKTLTILDLIQDTHKYLPHRWLVLCPKSVMNAAWMEDHRKFGMTFLMQSFWHANGNRIDEHVRNSRLWHCGVINYEAFKPRAKLFWDAGVRYLVLDESSKLKDCSTQTWKAVKKFADHCERVYALSGTPAPNDDSEYIPQIMVVKPDTFTDQAGNPRGYYSLMAENFTQHKILKNGRYIPVGRPRLIKEKAKDFWDKVRSCSTVIRKEDCLDLPEKTDVVREVALSDAEIRAYVEMKTMQRAILDASCSVNATNVLAAAMKLRQITSGFAYTGDGGSKRIGKSKLNALMELVNGELAHKQVVVWSVFTEEIDSIRGEVGEQCGVIDGRTPSAARALLVNQFQSGDLRVLVCHPGAAGHGITLTAASDAIYVSCDFSAEHYLQSRDRIHRIGQRHPCTYYHLIVPGTVDQRVLDVLQGKCDSLAASKSVLME